MHDEEKNAQGDDQPLNDLSRREFVALSLAAGFCATSSALNKELPVVETDVDIKTSDGIRDAVFFHPRKVSHPGILVWPDSGNLRPAFREVGKRIAGEGYSVLVPNHLYRMAKAPVFPETFDPIKNRDDAAFYRRITAPFFAGGAVERDASAYVAFLEGQKQVNSKKKFGVAGYCLGGAYVIKTAALTAWALALPSTAAFWSLTSRTAHICLRRRSRLVCILQSPQMTTNANPWRRIN
jgi:carboxymethylenebutenolidase